MGDGVPVTIYEPNKRKSRLLQPRPRPHIPGPISLGPHILGDGGGDGSGDGGEDGGVSGEGGEDTDLEGSIPNSVEALGPDPSDNTNPDGKHRDNLPQICFVDLLIDSSAKTQAVDQMETGEEQYPKWQPGKSERALRLQRAWVVHSAWASIENVCKILSSVLVNKLQCEHIADHVKVSGDVLKKLGLGKNFVSSQALEGGSGIQTNLTFDEMHFSRIAMTFETHIFRHGKKKIYGRGFHNLFVKSRIQDVSSMFEAYIRELHALDGSSEESLSKKSKTSEGFRDFSLQGMSTKENVEAQSRVRMQRCLDEFLCLLLGELKRGEDLVLFHSGLEGANRGVVERTGLYGEEFVQIHKLLYELLDFYACLEHCEGTEFARGYLFEHDSCQAQSLLYYLNSNCLVWYGGLDIYDDFLNIELATAISELLEGPNCILKRLSIESLSGVKVDQEELRKCRLMIIAALRENVGLTNLTLRGSNGEEVHELCKSLSVNKVLENLLISSDEALADNDAMNLSAMLKEKHNLERFTLEFKGIISQGAVYLGAMLAENSSLKEMDLTYRVLGKTGSKQLMRPSTAMSDQEPFVYISLTANTSLFINLKLPTGIAEIIAPLLSTNKTLTHFSIHSADSNPDVAFEILHSLKKNKTLQVLDLEEFKVLDNARVKIAFMDLLVNYNFTLSTIRMHGKNWDIEAFMKSKLEYDTIMAEGRLWSLVGGISESPSVHSAYDLKQALEDFQLEKGEELGIEVHEFFVAAFEELQKEMVGGCSSKPKKISRLQSKLEMESEQSLQELKPILESVMKSTNFLLQRNLNMAQLLQERYSQWNSFLEMYSSRLIDEEKNELSKGYMTASLFPTTFLYHLKARLLQGPNPRGILHTLKEVASLVVQRVKSLQDSQSQTFEFIDCVDFQAPLDVQNIYSPRETIAICQTFSTNTGIREELQAENSLQYGIVQDHLIGAYYVDSNKASNLNKPSIEKSVGVIGVKVTSIEILVEIMWEDGSYYSGALEDFSYDLELDDKRQCALEAFGDLEGAHFLETHGLKCSPLLVIALAMAIHKKELALTWRKGKGHIEIDSILPSLQPMELEVWECQILFGSDINQLGETVEWGMNQLDHNCASSIRVRRDNQCPVVLDYDVDRNMHISNIFNDTSRQTQSNVDLSAVVAQFNAGAQNKQKYSIGVKVLGSGGDIGFEKQNSKGKKVEDQSFKKMQELYWKEKGGYVIGKLDDRHELLEEKLCQGSLYAERDLNYLVVYDDCTASHVSIYLVKEWSDEPRLELEWITDIFIKEGPERIKKIFEGLKGETLEVTRIDTQFLENPSQRQSKGFMKRFMNRYSNKGSCKGTALQMVSKFENDAHLIFEGRSNNEWEHIVGNQPDQPNICSNNCWWKASYMQAITYSRTRFSSGLLLSTHKIEERGLKWGSCRRKFRPDGVDYVHKSNAIKSCGKFSKPPQSLSSKCHDMIHWGGLNESLV